MKSGIFIIAFFSFLLQQINAQTGEELFKTICSSCHTINKGKLVGPDLSGVYDKQDEKWLISFIRSSQTVIKSGDPAAVAIFNEFNKIPMPDNNLTDQQILSIIDFIRQTDKGSPAAAGTARQGGVADSTKISADSSATAVADSIPVDSDAVGTGKTYFYGSQPFFNGAAPCLTCHNINDGSLLGGGKLAIDLTSSYTRLGAAGITAILTNPPFPAMKAAIGGGLKEEEISALNSLLKSSAINSSFNVSFPRGMAFLVIALVIAIFMTVFLFLIYDDRKIPEGFQFGNKNSNQT